MKQKRAFTMVEILVVAAIIGLMASITVVMISQSRAKGRDAKRVADLNLIAEKINDFYLEKRFYPASLADENFVAWLQSKNTTLPKDPTTSNNYNYQGFFCLIDDECQQYRLWANLETGGQANVWEKDGGGTCTQPVPVYEIQNSVSGAVKDINNLNMCPR